MSTRYEAIVVGGGLAGMLTALALQPRRVALIAAAPLGEATSSAWAQGGLAAAVASDDAPALHAYDTVAAGAGLTDARVASRLADEAPAAVARLVALGVRFDRDADGSYALGREAAHSRRRILRAGGDATGAELVRAARAAVLAQPRIERFEGACARELISRGAGAARRIDGAIVELAGGEVVALHADAVVLATGGLGGLYRYTTNPTQSRGSGIALAARAGALLSDLEFVQFHPTALDVPSDPLPLVTEALRGEGALLIDEHGARIMEGVDPAGELAPRDVVARRVFAIRARGGRTFLDARALANEFEARFPTVFAACMRAGIDPRDEPIPVVAAAHYHMGGIAVDADGRASLAGLYACGETAATGVHGANRLASNSLLEAAVYPQRIAAAIASDASRDTPAAGAPYVRTPGGSFASLDASLARYRKARAASDESWRELRDAMYANAGVERDARRLASATGIFARIEARAEASGAFALRDAALVCGAVARAALLRRETRGGHVRVDHPETSSALGARSFATLDELHDRAGRRPA